MEFWRRHTVLHAGHNLCKVDRQCTVTGQYRTLSCCFTYSQMVFIAEVTGFVGSVQDLLVMVAKI